MHVSLTEKLEDYVRQKVASGLYNNASEVIREALRLKIAAEESDEARLQRLRDAIDIGWQQAERGELVPLDLDRILTELDAENRRRA
ncbi:type II toxin-antitoxin system ParD family antitoxin [Paracoccus sp. YIM 132242]|uniref:Type II toxin-antitoxin system ParD family antitoxin n=1 Tax=Paracoccus lichenicola TaxID=2665644 RepID=A0A6L6HKA8_9RHOB|nr:type II toxin-antitoxin system ParD family antitoxin [Paracoccus lichenicola]MTD99646.1 type II toxin-antitoxin system ParD family antitoxin [Paracoccus lichenicola]